MFNFRKIELSDSSEVRKRLAVSDYRGCEYSFANNCAWQRLNDSEMCFYEDFYLLKGISDGKPFLFFPAGVKKDDKGKKRILALFDEMERWFAQQGHSLVVASVTEEDLPWLKEVYGDRISYSYDPASSDYIYNTSDVIELKGKKYHGKRNHIKRFMENDWSFTPITENSIDECILFTTQFYNSHGDVQGSASIEQYAIHLFLMNMEELGLKGGILRMDGKIVGVTIGEQLNSDTFVIHIEKAISEINGAYPMLFNQFAKMYASGLKYINREEDMGIEGLRRSKQSYHPAFMLNKYTVRFG